MKYRQLATAAVLGLVLGAGFGRLGASVIGYNEEKYGAAYSSYHFGWLAVPALPGFVISQIVHDHDWQLGEAWSHRGSIVAWNSAVFGAAGLVFAALQGLGRQYRKA